MEYHLHKKKYNIQLSVRKFHVRKAHGNVTSRSSLSTIHKVGNVDIFVEVLAIVFQIKVEVTDSSSGLFSNFSSAKNANIANFVYYGKTQLVTGSQCYC